MRHPLDDRRGRAGGDEHSLERFRHQTGIACFLRCRNVGKVEPALLAGDRQRAQGARLYVGMRRRQGGDADGRGIRQQRLDGEPGAVVGNILHGDAGLELQQLRRQMRRGALSGIYDVERLVVGLRARDEFRK